MKLGLLGFPIQHSRSPLLYKELLGDRLTSYELFPFPNESLIPPLSYFSTRVDGLNITSPYKKHFFNEVIVPSALVKEIGALNTLCFKQGKIYGTNTDLVAIVEILGNYLRKNKALQLLLLGDGVMAKVTKTVAMDLKIPVQQFSRMTNPDLATLDLSSYSKSGIQTLIVNACSRDFIFSGKLSGNEFFWDYNYHFLPHQNTLPSQVSSYQDGQEMLDLQARAAIKFWETYI